MNNILIPKHFRRFGILLIVICVFYIQNCNTVFCMAEDPAVIVKTIAEPVIVHVKPVRTYSEWIISRVISYYVFDYFFPETVESFSKELPEAAKFFVINPISTLVIDPICIFVELNPVVTGAFLITTACILIYFRWCALQPNVADVVISVDKLAVDKPMIAQIIKAPEEVSTIGFDIIDFLSKWGIEGPMVYIIIPTVTVSLGSLLFYTFNSAYEKRFFDIRPKLPEAPIVTRIDNRRKALSYLHGGAWYFRAPKDSYAWSWADPAAHHKGVYTHPFTPKVYEGRLTPRYNRTDLDFKFEDKFPITGSLFCSVGKKWPQMGVRLKHSFACTQPGYKSFIDFDNLVKCDFESRLRRSDRDGNLKANWAVNHPKINKNIRYIPFKPTIVDHYGITWFNSLIRLHDEHITIIKRTGTPHLLDYSAVSRYAQWNCKKTPNDSGTVWRYCINTPWIDFPKKRVYSLDDNIKIVNLTKSMIHHITNVVITEDDSRPYKWHYAARRLSEGENDLFKKYNIIKDPSKSFYTKGNFLVKGQYVKC